MSSWQVVDLMNYSGKIETKRGRLIVSGTEVPLKDVTAIILGAKTSFSGTLILLAAEYDIPILICDWRGMPTACTFPWSENSRVGARQRAQNQLTLPKQKNAWMQVIKSKIQGQAKTLHFFNKDSSALLFDYVTKVRSGDPDNIEARAARTYWSKIPSSAGFTRFPGAGQGLNALLDYGYAIIRSVTVRGICEAGLSPSIGIWHHHRSNPFSLADDLIEPFRPAVDYLALIAGSGASLNDREVKQHMVSVLNLPMHQIGETVATTIRLLARDFANYVEGRTDRLKVPSWSPPRG